MKKLFLLSAVALIFSACSKEEAMPLSQTNSVNTTTPQLRAATVYANLSCELPNGEIGCQCTITPADDDCSKQTDCTPQSNLTHYSNVLNAMFTEAEIQDRAKNKVRITEPALIEMLKLDGFPVKTPSDNANRPKQ